MANSVYADDFNMKPLHMSAYGNAWVDDYSIANKAGAGDKLYLGIIPAGVRVNGIRLINTAATAGSVKIGFEPVDADGPTADDDAFFADTDLSDAGANDSTFVPVTFESPVKIVATCGTAFTASATLTAIVKGKCVGIK
jgi:hypothetical protein